MISGGKENDSRARGQSSATVTDSGVSGRAYRVGLPPGLSGAASSIFMTIILRTEIQSIIARKLTNFGAMQPWCSIPDFP
jgi:hypothetical protein